MVVIVAVWSLVVLVTCVVGVRWVLGSHDRHVVSGDDKAAAWWCGWGVMVVAVSLVGAVADAVWGSHAAGVAPGWRVALCVVDAVCGGVVVGVGWWSARQVQVKCEDESGVSLRRR